MNVESHFRKPVFSRKSPWPAFLLEIQWLDEAARLWLKGGEQP
jgi:hypothetical protein